MGIDVSYTNHIGFHFSLDDIMNTFGVKTEGKFHLEDRFDSKTGEKISPQKIWDEPSRLYYKFRDKSFGEENAFVDYLSEYLSCYVFYDGAFISGETHFIFSIHSCSIDETETFTKFIDFDKLVTLQPSLDKLKEELISIGLNPERPSIFTIQYCG